MQTVKDIRRRATAELRRCIFECSVFRRKHMKDIASTLARKHTAGMSTEKLLALARHDTWLKSSRDGNPHSPYPGEKTDRIADELLCYLRSELRILVDSFFEGRTSVELVVRRSSVDLAGFFNGERPGRQAPSDGGRDDAHSLRQASYA
jgi:hypothetical protein